MAELKVASLFEFEKVLQGHSNKLFYSKSEVDKVIAEQKERYFELQDTAIKIDEELTETKRQLRHQKYKRCLEKAKTLDRDATISNLMIVTEKEDGQKENHKKRAAFYRKWSNKWLDLAEKFKEWK